LDSSALLILVRSIHANDWSILVNTVSSCTIHAVRLTLYHSRCTAHTVRLTLYGSTLHGSPCTIVQAADWTRLRGKRLAYSLGSEQRPHSRGESAGDSTSPFQETKDAAQCSYGDSAKPFHAYALFRSKFKCLFK